MAARDRARAAATERTETRLAQQERQTGDSAITGSVAISDAEGTLLITRSGGRVRIPRKVDGPENVTPAVDGVYQVQVTGPTANLSINTQQRQQPQTAQAPGQQTLYKTRAPIDGQDYGQPGWEWVNIAGITGAADSAPTWIWAQPIARWVSINQITEEINGQIQAPSQGQVINIITSATYSSTISKLALAVIGGASASTTTDAEDNVTAGSTTITLGSAIGQTVAIDGTLTLTVTATDGSPISFTVGFNR